MINPGDLAFPSLIKNQDGELCPIGGMTKKEFATLVVLQGLMANPKLVKKAAVNSKIVQDGNSIVDYAIGVVNEWMAKVEGK